MIFPEKKEADGKNYRSKEAAKEKSVENGFRFQVIQRKNQGKDAGKNEK